MSLSFNENNHTCMVVKSTYQIGIFTKMVLWNASSSPVASMGISENSQQ